VSTLLLLGAAVPPLLAARVALRSAVDVPFWDQWDLVPLLQAVREGRLSLDALWASHNGHRIVLPRVVLVGLAGLTGWDTRQELALGLVLGLVCLGLLAWLVRRTVRDGRQAVGSALILTASFLLFTPAGWENWLWGWNVALLLGAGTALATAWAVAHPGPVYLACALGFGILSAVSYASGLALPFLVALAVAVRLPWPGRLRAVVAGALFTLAVLFVALYLRGISVDPPAMPGAAGRIGPYVLAYLGGTFGPGDRLLAQVAGTAGLLGFLGAGWVAWRRSPADTLPWLLVALYSLLTGVMAAIARVSQFGVEQALTSRYALFSSLFWISLSVLAALACRPSPGGAVRAGTRGRLTAAGMSALLVALVLGTIAGWPRAVSAVKSHRAALLEGQRCLIRHLHPFDWCAANIHYAPGTLAALLPWVERARLSLFAAGRVPRRPEAPRVAGDYNGDGKAEIGVLRTSSGEWLLLGSASGGLMRLSWGDPGDTEPVAADYDGDGVTDVGVVGRATGEWRILRSSDGAVSRGRPAPACGERLPVPGDYDGDGRAEMVAWCPADGAWLPDPMSGSPGIRLGGPDDVPVPADYDGDGRTDPAVWGPARGRWRVLGSAAGSWEARLGGPGDIPVPADYDGDGRADVAVWRPAGGRWAIRLSAGGQRHLEWGRAGDVPVAADYDGDGRADVAVFRRVTAEWLILRSGRRSPLEVSWGAPALGDLPLVGPLTTRLAAGPR
jgi:hypothetical protein